MKRLFWKLLYPFCWLNWRMGGSYKWVNVGKAAWHPELFNPLWHHEWFGDDIPAMPGEVNLCGIMHRVTIADGMIIFANPYSGQRIIFVRDQHDPHALLWSVETGESAVACHLDAAYRWAKAVYGGEHEIKQPVTAEEKAGQSWLTC